MFKSIAVIFILSLISVSAFRPANVPQARLSLKLFNKIKVKLLADVKGQGKKGEIITVSPAMYTNVLLPNKQAKAVTDTEIEKESKEKNEKETQLFQKATQVGVQIEALKGDKKMIIHKKVGANGQLFGTVTKKVILESLHQSVKDLSTLEEKQISITSIKSISVVNGSVTKGDEVDEIRKAGVYQVITQIHPKVSISFELGINSDK